MGRKGKRVHEQAVGSTALSHDYETIKVVPAQKQESTAADSKVCSGISAPPGLDAPVSRAGPTRPMGPAVCPLQEKRQYCSFPCCRSDDSHVLHRCKQHVNW